MRPSPAVPLPALARPRPPGALAGSRRRASPSTSTSRCSTAGGCPPAPSSRTGSSWSTCRRSATTPSTGSSATTPGRSVEAVQRARTRLVLETFHRDAARCGRASSCTRSAGASSSSSCFRCSTRASGAPPRPLVVSQRPRHPRRPRRRRPRTTSGRCAARQRATSTRCSCTATRRSPASRSRSGRPRRSPCPCTTPGSSCRRGRHAVDASGAPAARARPAVGWSARACWPTAADAAASAVRPHRADDDARRRAVPARRGPPPPRARRGDPRWRSSTRWTTCAARWRGSRGVAEPGRLQHDAGPAAGRTPGGRRALRRAGRGRADPPRRAAGRARRAA